MDVHQSLSRAVALHRLGRVHEARRLYGQILEEYPERPEALHFLSTLELESGNLEAAAALLQRLLALDPDFAPAHYHLGLVHQRKGQEDAALANYGSAIALEPGHSLALYNMAVILRARSKFADARDALARVVRQDPGWTDARLNYVEALLETGEVEDALQFADKLVATEISAAALLLRARALFALNRKDEALASCDRSIALAPSDVGIHHFRGILLEALDRFADAAASFDRALTLLPRGAPKQALENAITKAILMRLKGCSWAGLAELITLAERLTSETAFGLDPFVGALVSDDPELLRIWAERWHDRIGYPEVIGRTSALITSDKIRVGYISSDFSSHAVGRLIAGLIESHDRNRFRVVGYALGVDDGSSLRRRIEAAFDEFVDLSASNDEDAARKISQDNIDILVDLNGHTLNARLGIIARRPAPLIAHYLGFPGTIGMTSIDYFIADSVTAPAASEAQFVEAIARLPTTYQINDHREISPRTYTRAEEGLPEDAFVFSGVGRHEKLNPNLFDTWMEILRKAPQSVLWLLEGSEAVVSSLRREANARGVSPDRLIFARRLPITEYLSRQALADLFLDTWPWGGHTMASDALWAGVPVLTAPGPNFASRVGASLLEAVGLPELICSSRQAYVARAVDLAKNPGDAQLLRQKLSAKRLTSVLFDAKRITREMEGVFQEMYTRQKSGELPASFTAPEAG